MYGHPRRKWTDKGGWRTVLVVGIGILLGLILLRLAFPHKSVGEFTPPREDVLNIAENLGFKILKGSPSPSGGPVVIASVPIPPDSNCTYPVEYWRENPGMWPTDNFLVGQFTFTKEEILNLFLADTQDLATLLQRQFLAAALNHLSGADPSAVEASMREASAWIDAHPPLIDLDADERQEGELLAKNLEDYNRGLTGPGLCPEGLPLAFLDATPTPAPTESAPELKISSLPISKATSVATLENKRAQGSGRRPHSGSPAVDSPQPGPTPNPPVADAPANPPQSSPLPATGDPGSPSAGSEQPGAVPDGQPLPTLAAAPINQPISAPASTEKPNKEPNQEQPAPQPQPTQPAAPDEGSGGSTDSGSGGTGGGPEDGGDPGSGDGGGAGGDEGGGDSGGEDGGGDEGGDGDGDGDWGGDGGGGDDGDGSGDGDGNWVSTISAGDGDGGDQPMHGEFVSPETIRDQVSRLQRDEIDGLNVDYPVRLKELVVDLHVVVVTMGKQKVDLEIVWWPDQVFLDDSDQKEAFEALLGYFISLQDRFKASKLYIGPETFEKPGPASLDWIEV